MLYVELLLQSMLFLFQSVLFVVVVNIINAFCLIILNDLGG